MRRGGNEYYLAEDLGKLKSSEISTMSPEIYVTENPILLDALSDPDPSSAAAGYFFSRTILSTW